MPQKLKYGFSFQDLYDPHKLKQLHQIFKGEFEQLYPRSWANFQKLEKETLTAPQQSEILIETAKVFGDFTTKLFGIEKEVAKIQERTIEQNPIFKMKRDFLNLKVFPRLQETPISDSDYESLKKYWDTVAKNFHGKEITQDLELKSAECISFLVICDRKLPKETLTPEEQHVLEKTFKGLNFEETGLPEKLKAALKKIENFFVATYVDPSKRKYFLGWVSWVRPHKLDFQNLVPLKQEPEGWRASTAGHLKYRTGFKLTDPRMDERSILREIDYCIYCHQRDKDSCSKGFKSKEGAFLKNPLGVDLKGCPLDERISEMHFLRKQGEILGALSMIMLDNPMCPGTGHRICNDCMKGCIFQKQDPVNIPQNETAVLTTVLGLPYGFEIYSFLTRFNPLNLNRPYALPYQGGKIMVVGLGPAGYTLTHYLANEGFGVVGVDGLKIEPLPEKWTGLESGHWQALENYQDLKQDLDSRIQLGFGGVSEYGITVRWDKNFLSVIYLSLLRRQNVEILGGIRFGGTLELNDAWDLGFDHVALATGAGKPTIVPMKNNLVSGIRQASDFLMGLQLTGAFKKNSLSNLMIQLPAVVIGGGLTAMDTATESLAYYPIQVEKILEHYEELLAEHGEAKVLETCSPRERKQLATFLEHGKEIRKERQLAEKEKRQPHYNELCRKWGGVTVVYRKSLQDSPAYRLNHEEVHLALEEGLFFAENMSPTEAITNEYGDLEAMVFQKADGSTIKIPAKTALIAAGTQPNTIYEKEFPGTFKLDAQGRYFQTFAAEKTATGVTLTETSSKEPGAFFSSYKNGEKTVSFYGDNHPNYAGNVVKAMASSKHGYEYVTALFPEKTKLAEEGGLAIQDFQKFKKTLRHKLYPRVVEVRRLTPSIVEVVVEGEYAARKFEPGQFYRFQNYESFASQVGKYSGAMEGLALTGAWVDKSKNLLSMIVLEMGVSSRLCCLLKKGEPVIVMGPTGTPSEIPKNENVMLVGGGLGNAVLLSISRALKENGNKVLYFAGYKGRKDLFLQDKVAEATDQMVWACDESPGFDATRPQDMSFVGNIVEAITAYGEGKLHGKNLFKLNEIDRIFAIGSDKMMAAVQRARSTSLKPYLKPNLTAIGSINSPMQCMMKEVCAQCLQKHVDPVSGKETFIFSCFNQDQDMDHVDFDHLNLRLNQNSLQEKLSNLLLTKYFPS